MTDQEHPAQVSTPVQPVAQPAIKKPARARARPIAAAPLSTADGPAVTPAEDITMEEQITTATDQTKTMFADASGRAQSAMDKGARFFEEMGEFNKGNVEALVESGRIFARGVEAMSQEAAAAAKRSYEGSVAALRTLSTIKTPTEFLKVQGDLIRQSFDAMVAQTSHNTEATLKLAGEVAQPIQNRWALAADKVRSAA